MILGSDRDIDLFQRMQKRKRRRRKEVTVTALDQEVGTFRKWGWGLSTSNVEMANCWGEFVADCVNASGHLNPPLSYLNSAYFVLYYGMFISKNVNLYFRISFRNTNEKCKI